MKYVNPYYIFLISLLGLAGCEYEPEAINFKQVDSTRINTMQMDLSQTGDTIVIGTLTEVAVTLTFPKDVKFLVAAFIGGRQIYQSDQTRFAFGINPYDFENGFYPLTFEIRAGSGTNSLADRLELEHSLFRYRGKLVQIEKSPPQKINILSVVQQSDGLRITWPKYPKKNLKKFVLRKMVTPIVRGYSEFNEYHFTDVNQTSFVDQEFLGGNAFYTLEVITMSDESAFSDEYRFRGERALIKGFRTLGIDNIEVSWTKSQYSFAFGSYHLLEDYGYGAGDYYTSSNINDTVTTITEFPFGKPINAELRTQPVGYNPVMARDGTYSTFGEIYLGDRIPSDLKVLNLKSADRLYYYRDGYVYVIRHTDSKPYDSVAVDLNVSGYNTNTAAALSPDGQYLYVSSGRELIRLDPTNLDQISSRSLIDIFNEDVYPFTIAVNNGHRLIVDVRRGVPGNHGSSFLAIIDGETSAVTDTIRSDLDVQSIYTSDNQQYVFVSNFNDNKIFEISGAGLEIRRASVSKNTNQVAHFTADKAYLFDVLATQVFDLSNFTHTSSGPHPHFRSYSVDPLTGRLGALTDQFEYSVYDPLTMDLIHKFNIARYSNSLDSFVHLVNNHLISTHGYRLALP
jgi:hypothetical protein